jgi:hypothetical protein
MSEFDDPKYVDNPRNYMAGSKAPKGPGFAERVAVGQNDIVAAPVRGDAPITTDPHRHGGPDRPGDHVPGRGVARDGPWRRPV